MKIICDISHHHPGDNHQRAGQGVGEEADPCELDTIAVSQRHFSTNQRLNDLCEWANQWLEYDGPAGFLAEPRNHYDIANLVKLNMEYRVLCADV